MKEIRRILAPTDFSPYSDEGLRYAAFLAERFGAEVLVFHVILPEEMKAKEALPAPSGYADEIYQTTREDTMKHFLQVVGKGQDGLRVKALVTSGAPFVEIIRKAREERCDLIVMATHGRTGLSHILMGSVAEKVVRMADCPVVTIRPEDQKFEMP
jgi:nucleotide-binding universal stress UspA family protein